jgi:hypothetical protein
MYRDPGLSAEASLELRPAQVADPGFCTPHCEPCEQDPSSGTGFSRICTNRLCEDFALPCEPDGPPPRPPPPPNPCAGPSSLRDCTTFPYGSTEGCPPCEACLGREIFNCRFETRLCDVRFYCVKRA